MQSLHPCQSWSENARLSHHPKQVISRMVCTEAVVVVTVLFSSSVSPLLRLPVHEVVNIAKAMN